LNQPRANFAALAIGEYIYAYGGVSGNKDGHLPRLAEF
jgi:hypothetical protein